LKHLEKPVVRLFKISPVRGCSELWRRELQKTRQNIPQVVHKERPWFLRAGKKLRKTKGGSNPWEGKSIEKGGEAKSEDVVEKKRGGLGQSFVSRGPDRADQPSGKC